MPSCQVLMTRFPVLNLLVCVAIMAPFNILVHLYTVCCLLNPIVPGSGRVGQEGCMMQEIELFKDKHV